MKSQDDRIARYAEQVARGAQLAALDGVLDVLRRGERDGLDFEAVQAAAIEKLEREWIDAATKVALTVEVAVRRAMTVGRIDQLIKAKATRPYWLFSAILDDITSHVCDDCDGTCLPMAHRWWRKHICPLHCRCRSSVVSLTAEQAVKFGITANPPTDFDYEIEDGFGSIGDLTEFDERPGQYAAGTLDGVND
jgi:hypothetical protein